MSKESADPVQLQLAMAFGQGAGCMLATDEALEFALSEHSVLIVRARRDWAASAPAFTDLVRLLGQVAATKAAVDGKPQIELKHLKKALPGILAVCPCLEIPGRSK